MGPGHAGARTLPVIAVEYAVGFGLPRDLDPAFRFLIAAKPYDVLPLLPQPKPKVRLDWIQRLSVCLVSRCLLSNYSLFVVSCVWRLGYPQTDFPEVRSTDSDEGRSTSPLRASWSKERHAYDGRGSVDGFGSYFYFSMGPPG